MCNAHQPRFHIIIEEQCLVLEEMKIGAWITLAMNAFNLNRLVVTNQWLLGDEILYIVGTKNTHTHNNYPLEMKPQAR